MAKGALEAVIDEYRERFLTLLAQLCSCMEAMERNKALLILLEREGDLLRCMDEEVPCHLGPVEVRVTKSLFKRKVTVAFGGREYDREEALSLLARAKSFMQWYESDCSLESLLNMLVGLDHLDKLRNMLSRDLGELYLVCMGRRPSLNTVDLPSYVAEALSRAVNEYVEARSREAPRG